MATLRDEPATIQKLASALVAVPAGGLEAGLAFYGDALGLDLALRDGDRYAALACPGAPIALAGPGEHPAEARLSVVLKVTSLDAWPQRLRGLGHTVGEIESGPHERRCTVLDPFGNHVVLYEPS